MAEPLDAITGPNGQPALSLKAAARTTGLSLSTLRRRLYAGTFTGAFQDADGVWRIPHGELLVGVGQRTQAPLVNGYGMEQGPTHDLEQRLRDAEHQHQLDQQEIRAAQAIAVEKERTINALERLLNQLTTGNPTVTPANLPSEQPHNAPEMAQDARQDTQTLLVPVDTPQPSEGIRNDPVTSERRPVWERFKATFGRS